MDAARCLELHHLRREVMSVRDRGRVVIEFSDGVPIAELAEARHVADELIVLVNLQMLGPHWIHVDRERAAAILTAVLHWDLETLRPRVPLVQAALLTEKILGQFPPDAFYLTNVRASADITKSPHRWASGSELAELDAGVAIVSTSLAGLLWVEDRP
jgi:hypothetical protein